MLILFFSETRSMNPGDVDYLPSIFPTHITQRAIHYLGLQNAEALMIQRFHSKQNILVVLIGGGCILFGIEHKFNCLTRFHYETIIESEISDPLLINTTYY